MKPEYGRHRVTTQVKGLSPEITIVSEADAVHYDAGRILDATKGEARQNPTGSETVTRCQMGSDMNSGEPMPSLIEFPDKPINGKEGEDIGHRQSDYSVVSTKPVKAGGEKGIAMVQRVVGETSAGHGTGERMETQLATLTQRARENRRYQFITLAHWLTEEYLGECYRMLKRDKATGVDGQSVEEYGANLEENLRELVVELKSDRYRPQPVRRVYIPKGDGKQRGLGIPTTKDKVVQMGIARILEAIFEADFVEGISFGFRPGKSAHDAMDALDKAIMTQPVNHVVDMDIEKFFDTINHKWLMKCLEQRVKDGRLLKIIARILKAGVMEDGQRRETREGTPQGGIVSPVLANIYLHYVLDLWFEKEAKRQFKGYARLIRYADDFVVLFQYETEAKTFCEMLKERLAKFGLKISENKARVVRFGRKEWQQMKGGNGKPGTFDFLGFTCFCGQTRKGAFKASYMTACARFRKKIQGLNEWMKSVRNLVPLAEWWTVLQKKLAGHDRYFGISGNMTALKRFHKETSRLAYKWINRRSQKRSFSFKRYLRYLKFHPLPVPKIFHSLYTLAPSCGRAIEEPYVGNPQVRFCEGHAT
jgi:RNA-directed DNA polymerase